MKYAYPAVMVRSLQEEDLSQQVGFLIRCSNLKECTKSYKLSTSETIFKSLWILYFSMWLNIWKVSKINFLKILICHFWWCICIFYQLFSQTEVYLYRMVYVHLVSAIFSKGGLVLEKEFHYYLCKNLVFFT